jgi:hypothetical protein
VRRNDRRCAPLCGRIVLCGHIVMIGVDFWRLRRQTAQRLRI